MMTNDADWVEDVRRWYFNGGRPAVPNEAKPVPRKAEPEATELGYEAAQPSLQTSTWLKPEGSAFGTLR